MSTHFDWNMDARLIEFAREQTRPGVALVASCSTPPASGSPGDTSPAVAGGFPPLPPPAGGPIPRRDQVEAGGVDPAGRRPAAAPRDAYGVRPVSAVPASRSTRPGAAGSVPPLTLPPPGHPDFGCDYGSCPICERQRNTIRVDDPSAAWVWAGVGMVFVVGFAFALVWAAWRILG